MKVIIEDNKRIGKSYKTTVDMLTWASRNNAQIVCDSESRCSVLMHEADQAGCRLLLCPISICDLRNVGSKVPIVIEDIDACMHRLFPRENIVAATVEISEGLPEMMQKEK
jgi:hypothetical protein